MSTQTIAEAVDLIEFASRTRERLELAVSRLAGDAPAPAPAAAPAALGLASAAWEDERQWLETAARRVNARLRRAEWALEAALFLPERQETRSERTVQLLQAWVDAMEQVLSGIVQHASVGAPILEVLFPHQRFAVVRRGGAQAQSYSQEFQRRVESSYVRRLRADPEYPFLGALLDVARLAHEAWRTMVAAPVPSEEEAVALRSAVLEAADALELSLRQGRSLAEAALAVAPALVAELGLDAKPRKRREAGRRPESIPSPSQP